MLPLANAHAPVTHPTKGCAYRARVSFTWDGKTIEQGQPFPYADLGVHELRAYNMWSAGLLEVAPPQTAAAPVKPSHPAKHQRR